MRIDLDNWMPNTVAQINEIFSSIPITWFIAGGWALDLHIGEVTREHSDIDVVIFREQQEVLFESLKRDWNLYKAQNGKLVPWEDGEYLTSTNDVWVRKSTDSPWSFQIMFVDSIDNEWIYRREESIKREKNKVFLRTKEGIPYIKPEVQLLYKAGSSEVREKDFKDFLTMLPFLVSKEKAWLKSSLNKQYPDGHDWIGYL